jgi:hypothetical protein
MAKGRTNNAIRILVAPQFLTHPAILSLIGQGHDVEGLDAGGGLDLHRTDIILHPNANFFDENMLEAQTKKDGSTYYPYVDAAIQKGRANKKRRAKE